MKLYLRSLFLVGVGLLLAVANANAQNLFTNGDFATDLSGWSTVEGGTTTITYDGGSGNPSGSAALDRNDSTASDNRNYLYQIVPVSNGSPYLLSADWQGDLLNGGEGRNWAEVYVNFGPTAASVDPVTGDRGSIMYKKATDGGPHDVPMPFTWEDITLSPDGAGPSDGIFTATDDFMLVAFNLGGRDVSRNNTQPGFYSVDNASLTLIPEPSTLALLGLGSSFGVFLRRRRS